MSWNEYFEFKVVCWLSNVIRLTGMLPTASKINQDFRYNLAILFLSKINSPELLSISIKMKFNGKSIRKTKSEITSDITQKICYIYYSFSIKPIRTGVSTAVWITTDSTIICQKSLNLECGWIKHDGTEASSSNTRAWKCKLPLSELTY
jgi:hypothetical protein